MKIVCRQKYVGHRGVILAYEHLKDSVEKNFADDSNTSIKNFW